MFYNRKTRIYNTCFDLPFPKKKSQDMLGRMAKNMARAELNAVGGKKPPNTQIANETWNQIKKDYDIQGPIDLVASKAIKMVLGGGSTTASG